MSNLQGTYQYWGARLLSFLPVSTARQYGFWMKVDSAARLWVNNTLVIDATCMSSAQHQFHLSQQHAACGLESSKKEYERSVAGLKTCATRLSCFLSAKPCITSIIMLQVQKMILNPAQTVLVSGLAVSLLQQAPITSRLSTIMETEVVHL